MGHGGRHRKDDIYTERATTAMAMMASSMTFATCAAAAQRIGLVLGIGCGTPLVGGLASAVAVGASAALSGQSARLISHKHERQLSKRARGKAPELFKDVDVIRDIFIGGSVFLFLSRGNLSRIFPSDVARVGANAYKSVAAKGSEYATDGQRRLLSTWLKAHGCHHCGSKRGSVIGDHMPPNKKAFGSGAAAKANRRASLPRRIVNYIRGVPLQRFYPQCEPCSALQSVAVRTGMRKFVTHRVGFKYGIVTGAACGVAALHYDEIRNWIDENVALARKLFTSSR